MEHGIHGQGTEPTGQGPWTIPGSFRCILRLRTHGIKDITLNAISMTNRGRGASLAAAQGGRVGMMLSLSSSAAHPLRKLHTAPKAPWGTVCGERVPPTPRVPGSGEGRKSSSGLSELLTSGGVCPKEKVFLRKLLVIPESSRLSRHLGSSHTAHLGCVY